MDFIINIHFLHNESGNVLPKEVAVISLQGNVLGHWTIKSPHTFQDLPLESKMKNFFLTKNIHSIEWFDGVITVSQLKALLYQLM